MRLIDLDELLKYPIKSKNKDKNYVSGIESVLGYAGTLPIKVEQTFEDGLCPCDLCKYNPPSSLNGKPCTICPAAKKQN